MKHGEMVAYQTHNLKVVGSNPAPATNFFKDLRDFQGSSESAVATPLLPRKAPAHVFFQSRRNTITWIVSERDTARGVSMTRDRIVTHTRPTPPVFPKSTVTSVAADRVRSYTRNSSDEGGKT